MPLAEDGLERVSQNGSDLTKHIGIQGTYHSRTRAVGSAGPAVAYAGRPIGARHTPNFCIGSGKTSSALRVHNSPIRLQHLRQWEDPASPEPKIGALMPSTSSTSDNAMHVRPDADPEPGRAADVVDSNPPAVDGLPSSSSVISEHRVMLGTAASVAPAPSLDDEPDGEDAPQGETPTPETRVGSARNRWIARLMGLGKTPRDRRPRRPHYLRRFDYTFIADARMAREMDRL
jgi:hypothetical protein